MGLGVADDVDEEDRRPTQRRRIMEEAQAGGFDENMEPLVRPHRQSENLPLLMPSRAPLHACQKSACLKTLHKHKTLRLHLLQLHASHSLKQVAGKTSTW